MNFGQALKNWRQLGATAAIGGFGKTVYAGVLGGAAGAAYGAMFGGSDVAANGGVSSGSNILGNTLMGAAGAMGINRYGSKAINVAKNLRSRGGGLTKSFTRGGLGAGKLAYNDARGTLLTANKPFSKVSSSLKNWAQG